MRTPPFDGKREKRIERSGSAARTSSRARVSRLRGTATKQRFRAAHCGKIDHRCGRIAGRESLRPQVLHFVAACGADIRMLADDSGAHLDWPRFADTTAGVGPNGAMKPPQTERATPADGMPMS
jgi:hypothetical protein